MAHNRARIAQEPDPLRIEGLSVPGVALKYPLSGLVLCDECGRAMTASAGGAYVAKNGEERRYVAYVCPGTLSGQCANKCHIPEPWLRETVAELLRTRLFFGDDNGKPIGDMTREDLFANPCLCEFVEQVQDRLSALQPDESRRRILLAEEREKHASNSMGWGMSLGNVQLSIVVRRQLEANYEEALGRMAEIDAELAAIDVETSQVEAVSIEGVVDHLMQLPDILASQNPSACNVLLSQHIDGIYCRRDETVMIRTCKLGALAGAIDLVPRDVAHNPVPHPSPPAGCHVATPRRRGRRDVGAAFDDDEVAAAAREFAADTGRFAGLPAEWFTEDTFTVQRTLSWARMHAVEVAQFRLTAKATMEVTAAHFSKTIPTIRAALRYAGGLHGIDALGKQISKATRAYWARDNAQAVADFVAKGETMAAAIEHFGKCDLTIKKAQRFAAESEADS